MRMKIAGIFVAMCVVSGGMTRGATTVEPVAPRVSEKAPHGAGAVRGVAMVNPHLHGVKPVTMKGVKAPVAGAAKGPTTAPARRGRLWRNGWDALEWRTNHLRYGKVEGVLVDASGHALAGKVVWLRNASGHPVRHHWEAHVTHTDASGHFSMSHVIAKAYRLCARIHGHVAHEQIDVQAGTRVFEHLVSA